MTLEELDTFLENLPAEEKAQLIETGKQYGSDDTLAQADKTLNALATENYAALVAGHGFGPRKAARLAAVKDALEKAGGRRSSAQAGKKTTNTAYDSELLEGKKIRGRALSILDGALTELKKKPDEDAKKAADAIAAIVKQTSSVGADARSLAGQLELFLGLLSDNKLVAAEVEETGGPKTVEGLQTRIKTLRAVSSTVQTPGGTPVETEHMNLLDSLIIELCRSARKSARSAAKELGEEAIATAFELDKLYRVNNQSKADAARRQKKAELILKTLSTRKIAVSQETEGKIRATKDEAVLDRWVERASSVTSEAELFAPS